MLQANRMNPPIKMTGAPIDGGQTCAVCHQPSGAATGSVAIDATTYLPGVQQTLHVTITDPLASRWGFQLTARVVNNEAQEAGILAPADSTVTVVCDDGTTLGSAAPCNGAHEFAEQANAQNTASVGSYTFLVNWTPPPNEVGKIVFYFSGVAANNDGTANGDHVYTGKLVVSAGGACNNAAAPVLNKPINAGSLSDVLSGRAMWAIKGLNFSVPGFTRVAGVGDLVNGAFPTQLACIAVELNGVRAPITYVQQDQINLQAPDLQPGPVTIKVIANPDRPNQRPSAIGMVNVQAVSPAWFPFSGTSIAAVNPVTGDYIADPSIISFGKRAKPGDYVSLFGTGFGPTNPAVDPGALAPGTASTTNLVTVTINGQPVQTLYSGLVPTAISGLYQINIQIPANTPSGDIPVVATVGGVSTPIGTIPVTSSP